MFYFPLGILVLAEAASLYLKRRCFVFKCLFIGAIILILGWSCFQSYQQYQIWSGNALSKYFIPPYQSIAYFLKYSFTLFFKSYLISLMAGLLFLWLANLLNNRCQKRFFEEGEPYLGTLAIFVLGQPFWIFYFIAMMLVGFLGSLFLALKAKKNKTQSFIRFPFYHFWIPVAIIVMIIGKILI